MQYGSKSIFGLQCGSKVDKPGAQAPPAFIFDAVLTYTIPDVRRNLPVAPTERKQIFLFSHGMCGQLSDFSVY